jgi:hypothetical protein
MNLITKAVKDVQYAIPREILKMAYLESSVYSAINHFNQSSMSLDEAIRTTTIVPRVVVDCNVVGGQTVLIDAKGLTPLRVDNDNYIFQIPPDRLGNRTILSVLSVNFLRSELLANYGYGSMPAMTPMVGSDLSSSTARAMDSRGSIPVLSSSDCKVVGQNVIMIRNQMRAPLVTSFRCIVEHEEGLENISLFSSPEFTKLCTYAVKSYIFNELHIKLDRGRIERGHEIGAIKSLIDSYSDAEENYWTYLMEQWAGVAIHSDRLTYGDLLHMQINPSM